MRGVLAYMDAYRYSAPVTNEIEAKCGQLMYIAAPATPCSRVAVASAAVVAHAPGRVLGFGFWFFFGFFGFFLTLLATPKKTTAFYRPATSSGPYSSAALRLGLDHASDACLSATTRCG